MIQPTIFASEDYTIAPDEWCSDDWETPDEVAAFMGSLVTGEDLTILEPAAGTGQIAKYLPDHACCIELNPMRHLIGQSAAKDGQLWACDDYLDYCARLPYLPVHLVIGNPPFSLGLEFLAASVQNLASTGRILFLLPSEYFQSQARAIALQKTGLVITHQWAIAGRVGFLKNGKVYNQRQCYDSVFEFRLSGKSAVEIVDPYGKLCKH